MLKRLTIKQLLVLAFILAGLLPAIMVSTLSFYQSRAVIKQEIKQDLQTISAALATDLSNMLHERMRNVQSWSQLAVMQEAKIGDIDKRLSIFLKGLSQSYGGIYQSIYVVDNDGLIIASSDAGLIGLKPSHSPLWFETHLDQKQLTFARLREGAVPVSAKIIDETEFLPLGNLVAEFNWLQVDALLSHATDDSTAAALLNQQSQPLAQTNNWHAIESAHGMHAASQVEAETGLPEWHIRIEKLHEVAIAPVHKLGYAFFILLLVLLVMAAVMVLPIASAITEPLQALTAFVRSFVDNHQSPPPQTGPPEVRELSDAFEKMMQDLEKSQSDLTRAAKLAVVGEMAAAMSHEVRTPLGILRSSADVLKREKNISPEGKEVVTFIGAETERLNKLVSTLIDAARPRPPSFVPTDLPTLIRHNIAMLKTQADKKQISLQLDVEEENIIAEVDADKLTQVIMNLVMNAIQVLPEEGAIALMLKQSDEQILIQVMDNGQGIDESLQAQIFEPFFTNRSGGVGLGLAIVRQIIEAHQGKISYQTSELGGAQFNIRLPRQHNDE